MRPVVLFGVSAVTICLFLTTRVQADMIFPTTSLQADPPPIGHQGFVALAPTKANTGHVNTATVFHLGTWTSTLVDGGFFAGPPPMPTQMFGTVVLNLTMPNGFTFGNGVFGHFASTSIMDEGGATGFRNIFILGDWTPGTFGGLPHVPIPSEFTVTLTQTPPGTGGIAAAGTFATPRPVPDGGMTLMLLGCALVGLESLRRRFRV